LPLGSFLLALELLRKGFQHGRWRLIDAAPDQQGPDCARNLVGERCRDDLDRTSLQHDPNLERDFQAFKPSFSKLDDRRRTDDQQRPQLSIPRFDIAPSLSFPPLDRASALAPSRRQNLGRSQNRARARPMPER